jgi:hypothetical protein
VPDWFSTTLKETRLPQCGATLLRQCSDISIESSAFETSANGNSATQRRKPEELNPHKLLWKDQMSHFLC